MIYIVIFVVPCLTRSPAAMAFRGRGAWLACVADRSQQLLSSGSHHRTRAARSVARPRALSRPREDRRAWLWCPEQAKILFAEAEENNLSLKVKNERWLRWYTCSLCEQDHHGDVRCALGWACWKTCKTPSPRRTSSAQQVVRIKIGEPKPTGIKVEPAVLMFAFAVVVYLCFAWGRSTAPAPHAPEL
jgi:hypothetical protein